MKNKIISPSILPGFMELLPSDQISFNKLVDVIKSNYEKAGFIPLDTPILEKSEVLLAKSSGETEKQVYRFMKGTTDISMRFDLTVPLARYVAQHMSELNFPFRRYQMGKVYRGERNQRGRFREFYQFDIDIIGSENLHIVNDAELPSIIYTTFKDLGFSSFTIHINNRKILNGFFESLEIYSPAEVLRTIDKLDKIGINAVCEELLRLDLEPLKIEKIKDFISIEGSNDHVLDCLNKLKIENETFKLGLEELSTVVNYIRFFNVPEKNFTVDLKIARGLDYYTGTVYETTLDDYPSIGSVCSGGRYENLAGFYTKQKLPGVGVSIGLTRLFYQLREAKVIGEGSSSTVTEVLVIPLDDQIEHAIVTAGILRDHNIKSEIFFEDCKMSKKLNYANKIKIPYVIIIGEEETSTGLLTLKNMETGSQEKVKLDEIISKIRY